MRIRTKGKDITYVIARSDRRERRSNLWTCRDCFGRLASLGVLAMTIFFFLLSTIHYPLSTVFAADWKEFPGDHFLIYYTGDDDFAENVSRSAEKCYREIAIGMGYPRYDEFWTWANRVKIYIYPDRDSYLKASNMSQWSNGMADYDKKIIISYLSNNMFIDSVLPHEITHLIFRDFVGFKGEIPLWLDEGVAQWAEKMNKNRMRELKDMIKGLYQEDRLLTVSDMMNLDITRIKSSNTVHFRPTFTKDGKPATVILDTNALISSYYLVSVSVLDFLIEKYGSERFAELCRQLRDGKTVEEALFLSYPTKITGLADLEKKWREYLAQE